MIVLRCKQSTPPKQFSRQVFVDQLDYYSLYFLGAVHFAVHVFSVPPLVGCSASSLGLAAAIILVTAY